VFTFSIKKSKASVLKELLLDPTQMLLPGLDNTDMIEPRLDSSAPK
ncbi:12163_t:CDS:2, partial [Entrophospora sp. SA101]